MRAESVVDYDKERILFMVSMLDQSFTNLPGKNIVNIPTTTEENGFSNFESYAGIHTGYLIWFLEELSALIREDVGLRLPKLTSMDKSYHPGFGTSQILDKQSLRKEGVVLLTSKLDCTIIIYIDYSKIISYPSKP